MKPSQPYQTNGEYKNSNNPENGAPPAYQDTAPFSQATEKTGARLNPRKRLNDPIFLVLFIASIGGFAAVSAIAIKSFVEVNGLGGGFGNVSQGGTGNSATLDLWVFDGGSKWHTGADMHKVTRYIFCSSSVP